MNRTIMPGISLIIAGLMVCSGLGDIAAVVPPGVPFPDIETPDNPMNDMVLSAEERETMAHSPSMPEGLSVFSTTPQTGRDALNVYKIENNIVSRINIARTNRGLRALSKTAFLTTKARQHSAHMAALNNLHHDPLPPGVNGQNICYVITGNVYFPCNGGLHYIANTPQRVGWAAMDMFMNHDACQGNGHRKNILRSWFTKVGVGVKYSGGKYWITQNFA